jgi:hypothetical protein
MTTQQRLVTALRAQFEGESDAAIARRVGLSQQRFHNYANSSRTMDDDAIIGCATALGIDVRKTLAAHRSETSHTERERHFWRKLGTAAAVACVALLFRENPDHASLALLAAMPLDWMHYAH